MSIGSRQNLSNYDELNIAIDNEDISNVDNQKLLGIIIDKTLSWDKFKLYRYSRLKSF